MDIVLRQKDIRVIGKNKNFRSYTARFFAGLLLLQLLVGTLSLALPQSATAATTGGAINQEGNFTCKPVIAGPNDDYLNGAWQHHLTTVGFPNDSKIAGTFAEIYERKNKVFIYFTGENSNNDSQCRNTMLLVQSADPEERDQFYGAWYGPLLSDDGDSIHVAAQPYFQSATVNPQTKTINFHIPNLQREPDSFSLNVTPSDSSIWTNPAHFPQSGGGGGGTSTGQCDLEIVEASSPCVTALSATFTDAATITMDGEIYKATYWGGSNMKYMLTSSPNANRKATNTSGDEACTPYFELNTGSIDINIDDDNAGSTREALQNISNIPGDVELKYVNKSTGCGDQGETTKMVSTLGFKRIAKLYPAENSIRLVFPDGRDHERKYIGNYQKVDDTHYALSTNPYPGCEARPPQFVLSSKHTGGAGSTVTATWQVTDSACNYIDAPNIRVVLASANATSADDGIIDDAAGGSVTEEGPTCESQGVLGWLLCPVITILDAAIFWLDDRITALLTVQEADFTRDELIDTWARLRNLALLILVPMMLVMVISTALGFSMIDAYTVKKSLPRLVAATLFISLSWYIVVFMIEFTNNVGQGVQGLIMSSFFDDTHITLKELFGWQEGSIVSIAAGIGIAGAALAGALSFGIIGSYALAAFLGLLIAFLVLTLRQMLILAFMLLAPLAILAWIFPGNDKLWKLWWSSFTKLLLMFPLIMALLASGKVFAKIIETSMNGNLEAPVRILMMLTAYIAPYFFIPATFKFAGGVFATLAGMANDRERGIFDRLKNGRAEQRKALHERAGANRRFGPNSRLARFNNIAGWAADPLNNARVALGTEKGRAIMSEITQKQFEDSQKLMEVLSRNGFNAEELSALSIGRYGRNADGSRFWIRAWDGSEHDLDRVVSDLGRSVDAQDRIGSQHLRDNGAFLLETFRNEEYGRANIRAAAGLAYAAQGFATPDEIARLSQELNEGTPGLGAIFKTNAELLSARGGGLGKPGYTVRLGADGRYFAPTGTDGAKIEQVIRSGVQDFSGAKGAQLTRQLGDAMEYILTADDSATFVDASGETRNVADIRGGVEETLVQTLTSYAAPDVKRRVEQILTNSYRAQGMSDEDITRLMNIHKRVGNSSMTPEELAALEAARAAEREE